MLRSADVFFFDLHPQGTFSDHLSELDDFPQKSMFLKIEQKILLRATKNLKFFQDGVFDLKYSPKYWYGAVMRCSESMRVHN